MIVQRVNNELLLHGEPQVFQSFSAELLNSVSNQNPGNEWLHYLEDEDSIVFTLANAHVVYKILARSEDWVDGQLVTWVDRINMTPLGQSTPTYIDGKVRYP